MRGPLDNDGDIPFVSRSSRDDTLVAGLPISTEHAPTRFPHARRHRRRHADGSAAPLRAQVIHRIGKPSVDTASPTRPVTVPKRAPVVEGHPTLSGIVYDSLHDEPVRGATVVIAGTTHQAITDSTGMYHFDVDSLPEGVVTVGFFMAGMDSLGITPPPRQVGIHHGESALLDLGVPSMRTVASRDLPRQRDRGEGDDARASCAMRRRMHRWRGRSSS